jgi:hypothetical protein
MNKVPSDHHFVDGAGYRLQTRGDRCIARSRNTVVDGNTHATRVPVPEAPTAGQPLLITKRSRILIQSLINGDIEPAFIGGDGVESTNGYPLAEGESIDLPLTPGVSVYSVRGTGLDDDPNLRTLELG